MIGRKTTPSIRGTTPEIERRAIELRSGMTPAEEKLWDALKGKKLGGLRFRAQHPIGRFILDFYCPAKKLVVELDGDSHLESQERDSERTAYLEASGLRVIRFENRQVHSDISKVLELILVASNEV